MKILYIVPYAPTPIRTRPYNLLIGLLGQGHQVTLATVWENETEKSILADFTKKGMHVLAAHLSRPRIAKNLVTALIFGHPLQANYSWQPEVARQVDALCNFTPNSHQLSPNFDIIHIEHLRGAIYGLRIRSKQTQGSTPPGWLNLRAAAGLSTTIPIVWDSVDNISALFEQAARRGASRFGRWVTQFEIPRTRRFEASLLDQFQQTLVTSPVDKRAFEKLLEEEKHCSNSQHSLPIEVLTNGVDLITFRPAETSYQRDLVIFSGKLSYHANISAALYLVKQVMPIVWERRPHTRVLLAGKDPHSILQGLSKEDHRIELTGTVPDLPSYIQRAAVAVATITYGAGVQNKVLEAMACATPVVATSKAISALQAQPEHEILVADDPNGLAAQILRLLEDEQLRQSIAQNGLDYVRRNHKWNPIATQLVTIYEKVVHNSIVNSASKFSQ